MGRPEKGGTYMPTAAPSGISTEKHQATSLPEISQSGLPVTAPPVREVHPAAPIAQWPAPSRERRSAEIFYGSLLDFSSTRPPRATRDFAASMFIHGMVITVLLLVPLVFTEAIDLSQFTRTYLVAPPPPPPPPPPPAQLTARSRVLPKRILSAGGKLLAPTVIPESVSMVHEKPLPPDLPDAGLGVAGGVPGGVPGGQVGGILGSILSGTQKAPPPVAVAHSAPIRVGGRVKPPRKIYAPAPEYPILARQARIEGVVIVDAVIDTNGNVVEAQAVSGPPLLLHAALDAVRQWRFEPTYLNDEPVDVKLLVTVEFHLSGR